MSRIFDKLSKVKKSSWITIGLFGAAAAAIGISAIGGTRAALTYFSEDYSAHVEMYDIGVSLLEESDKDTAGQVVSYRNYITGSNGQWSLGNTPLLSNLLDEGEDLVIGKEYKEKLSVKNSGTINEYVRVKVYKYWVDRNGRKVTTLSPDLIDLHFAEGTGWILGSRNSESAVLYYSSLLPSGATSAPFTDTLTVYIDDTITEAKHQEINGNIVTYTYDYDGYRFQIEAEVDAVQEHNAADAILSAWGVSVNAGGGSLSLN